MKILITIRPYIPKGSRRGVSVTAIAHMPDTYWQSSPSIRVYLRPKPGKTGMDVWASVFGLPTPIMLDVEDGFFELPRADATAVILDAIREAVRAMRPPAS